MLFKNKRIKNDVIKKKNDKMIKKTALKPQKPLKPIVLIIRDGWGYRKNENLNAPKKGKIPFTDNLMKKYPHVLIDPAGEAVGLPKGYQGNSEVGHLTMGAGRIVLQPFEQINMDIQTKKFFKNKILLEAINNCKKHKSYLHIMGLLQKEGVHAHINHCLAILDLCKMQKFKEVYIHVFSDGRDAPVNNTIKNVRILERKIKSIGIGKIVSISGRYYAMDRDKRWNRTKKAYDCIVNGKADEFTNPVKQFVSCYNKGETDEFIVPRKLKGYSGINKNDSVIFYNYRTDRPRQLTQAMIEPDFKGWKTKPLDIFYVAMTKYYEHMNKRSKIAFEREPIKNNLAHILESNKIKQLRISETEKYAHVTFFFNSEIEVPYKGEDRILIPSPKVATYDLKPEMSAFKITSSLLKELSKNKYDVIIMNFPNGDMVGHTGSWKAVLKAVNAVDECVEKITKKVLEMNGVLLITADHGNCEDMTEKWRTSHTLNKVPFILVSNDEKLRKIKLKKNKGLQDISPTILKLLGIKKPKEMTGGSII